MNPSVTTDRIYNFSAGPAILPESVLEKIREDVWNIDGSGIGVLEHSHRGPIADVIFEQAEARCREIGNISDDHAVLFIQGGATGQFGMIPMNYLPEDGTADYPDTGTWTKKAIEDARVFGNVNVAFEGSKTLYDHVPTAEELTLTPGAAYFHYCSNNTVMGTRFTNPPETDAPLICDASSEFFARPMDINRHAMVYGGAQKNLGPSGVALVIVHREMFAKACRNLPSLSDYARHDKAGSRLNTPPVFGVYCMNLVFEWILAEGGVDAFEKRNADKANIIYNAIDNSGGFYKGHSYVECRSDMNITFHLPSEDLENKFLKEAEENSMSGLAGHRSLKGIRASIYNAFPTKGCEFLASFMNDFASRNG